MKKPLLNKRRQDAARLVQSLHGKFDKKFLPEDPVFFAHQFSGPRDREIVAFLSSLLAFGNVKAIHQSVHKLLQLVGPDPAQFIVSFDETREAKRFEGLGHRWVRGGDLKRLMVVLKGVLTRYGSLKACFLEDYNPGDPDISRMLDGVSVRLKKLAGEAPLSRGFGYFFPSPRDGSPCKRLNMFLRWMVRPADGIDLGLWPEIPPSKLVIPLDVHVYRFAKKFHLSRFKTPRWEVARDVTDFLKTLDPEDPVKYDFAICHYGMEAGWQEEFDSQTHFRLPYQMT